jgi:glycosyltransferase involved in cell wall biosynthesis
MLEKHGINVSVIQPGPRLHYAVPALLQRAGMLKSFYTDLCASVGPLCYIRYIWPAKLQPSSIRRMLGRRLPPDMPRRKVHHIAGRHLVNCVKRKLGIKRAVASSSEQLLDFARARCYDGANAVYTVMVNDDLDFCREAKARGCRIIHEVMLNPDIGIWLDNEHKLFRDIARDIPTLDKILQGRQLDRQKYEVADLILVPSEFVYRSVIDLGADPAKVKLVPYGINENWFETRPQPIPGRVLFVGTVGLLKGCHYLAEAKRLLASRNISCDVRIVGPAPPGLDRHPLFSGLNHIGQVPRSDVRDEFLAADVFALPSLCEGFALAHLEALASGVPVITTPNCGSVVRDGIDGLIVPIRNPAALANAIESIITNRQLRAQMSANARARAQEFSSDRYGERLINAISTIRSLNAQEA